MPAITATICHETNGMKTATIKTIKQKILARGSILCKKE
jgi:hypothetical protein